MGGPNSITSNSVYISFCCFSFPLRNIDFKAGNKSWINEIGFPWFHVCYRSWGDLAVTPKYAEPHRRSKKKKKKFPPAPSIRPILNHIPTFLFLWVCWLRKREQWERKRRENKCHQPLSPTGIHTSTSHTCYRCNTASFPSLPFFFSFNFVVYILLHGWHYLRPILHIFQFFTICFVWQCGWEEVVDTRAKKKTKATRSTGLGGFSRLPVEQEMCDAHH